MLEHSPSLQSLAKMAEFLAQGLTNEEALEVPDLYPPWLPGTHYGGENEPKVVCTTGSPNLGYKLYRCITPHTAQEDWHPSKTPALWTYIDRTHAGTLDDPIPATRGMEYVYGMYYSDPEDNGLYKCTRTGEADWGTVTLQYLPHELVGHYFVFVRSLSE